MTIVSAPIDERAHEDVEALDRRLQVHEALAGVVVLGVELGASAIRVTPTHCPPSNGFMYSG